MSIELYKCAMLAPGSRVATTGRSRLLLFARLARENGKSPSISEKKNLWLRSNRISPRHYFSADIIIITLPPSSSRNQHARISSPLAVRVAPTRWRSHCRAARTWPRPRVRLSLALFGSVLDRFIGSIAGAVAAARPYLFSLLRLWLAPLFSRAFSSFTWTLPCSLIPLVSWRKPPSPPPLLAPAARSSRYSTGEPSRCACARCSARIAFCSRRCWLAAWRAPLRPRGWRLRFACAPCL